MNPHRVIPLVVLIAAIAAIAVFMFRPEKGPVEETSAPSGSSEPTSPAAQPNDSNSVHDAMAPSGPRGPREHTAEGKGSYDTGIANDPRVRDAEGGKRVFIEATALALEMGKPEREPEQDLEQFGSVLSFYRMAFEENPVAADNASVMAALMGENPRSLVFFPEDHPSINERGELIDPWETPYYFHALSATQMEIVSLGPDLKLGTDDDLIHTQRNPDDFFQGFTEPPPEPDAEE